VLENRCRNPEKGIVLRRRRRLLHCMFACLVTMSLVEFVQTLCEPCFPPHYNIVNRYIAMYHSNISQHVSIECLRHLRHHQQSFLLHLRITRLHIVCCTVQMCVCACACVCVCARPFWPQKKIYAQTRVLSQGSSSPFTCEPAKVITQLS